MTFGNGSGSGFAVPNLWITDGDLLLCSSVAFKKPTKQSFLLITYCKYFKENKLLRCHKTLEIKVYLIFIRILEVQKVLIRILRVEKYFKPNATGSGFIFL